MIFNMKKIRKAVIPVAGFGTRFLPITKSVAKEMLPIVDTPSIEYIVKEALNSGIEEILFITNSYKKCIEDYFDVNYELESRLQKSNKINELKKVKDVTKIAKVTYTRQGEPLGTAHAIKIAQNFVGNEPFAVLYGDDLIKSDTPVLKQLIDIYEKYDCNVIGVQQVPKEEVNRYGIIEYENESIGKIKSIVEKPNIDDAPSNSAGLGRYIVKPEIFDEIDKLTPVKGEYLFTDAMLNLMKRQEFYACRYEGKYYDIGNKLGYIKANIEFALDRDELKKDLQNYLKEIEEKNEIDNK